jgi:membrane protein
MSRPAAVGRVTARIGAARDRAATSRAGLEVDGPEKPVVDVALSTVQRDVERAGGLLAGALAYRFLFWLLPFVLVVVGGLGFLGAADDAAPRDLARSAGVFGFAAQSIAQAGEDAPRTRTLALAVGLPALYIAGGALMKALSISHALMWGTPIPKVKRKPVKVVVLTGVLILIAALIAAEGAVRDRVPGLGLAVVLAFVVALFALWLFVSHHLPRSEGTTWWDLVPGALAVAVGAQVVHLVTIYYVSRKLAGASSTYGTLGAAASVLLSLFFIARVVVAGAALNAELWHHRQRRRGRRPAEGGAVTPPAAAVTPPAAAAAPSGSTAPSDTVIAGR